MDALSISSPGVLNATLNPGTICRINLWPLPALPASCCRNLDSASVFKSTYIQWGILLVQLLAAFSTIARLPAPHSHQHFNPPHCIRLWPLTSRLCLLKVKRRKNQQSTKSKVLKSKCVKAYGLPVIHQPPCSLQNWLLDVGRWCSGSSAGL